MTEASKIVVGVDLGAGIEVQPLGEIQPEVASSGWVEVPLHHLAHVLIEVRTRFAD